MTASLGVLCVPVVGVVSSMLILGDRPTVTDLIGFALIFAASVCVLLGPQVSGQARSLAANHKKLCGSTSTSSLMLPFAFGAAASHSRR